MDQDAFTRGYFKLLAQKLAPHGYDPAALVTTSGRHRRQVGTMANAPTRQPSGTDSPPCMGSRSGRTSPCLTPFTGRSFNRPRPSAALPQKPGPRWRPARPAGHRVALATNPIFPAVATESRIRWAGLAPETFAWYTTYENIGYCKPNPDYYREILRYLDCRAEDCLMVGNDVEEDMMAAQAAGLSVFLLTDCLLNRKEKDISSYPQGDFDALLAFVEEWGGEASL